MTSEMNMTSVMITSSIPLISTDNEKHVPDVYLSTDHRLSQFLEFQVAVWLDSIYIPICAGLGILGNVLSFCVLLSPGMSGTSTSVYMAALSVFDTLIQIVNILFLVRRFPGHEVLRQGTCGFVWFLLFFSLYCSVMVIVGMTLERYLVIRYPLKASRWCTPRRARMVVVGVCVIVFGINCHNLILRKMVWNDVMKVEACGTDGPANEFFMYKIWPWIDGSLHCYIPVLTLSVLNVLIVQQMRSAQKFRGTSGATDQQVDVSRQVTIMLLFVTCTFLLLVSPMAVILVVERYVWIRTTLHEQAVFHLIRVIINNLSFTNHAINFCLYCLSGQRFRQEFVRLFLPCLASTLSTGKGKQPVQSLYSVKPPSIVSVSKSSTIAESSELRHK